MRLRPYVRPYRRRLRAGTALASLAALLGLAMPQILKWIVDGPLARRSPSGVLLGGLALLLVGAAEAVLFGVRRRVTAGPLASIEAGMRADFHRHAQRLPVSVHDGWSSGQLLSRGMADPQVVRMVVAGPLTFLPVHVVTLVVGAMVLLVERWTLAVVVLSPVLPLIALSYRFESRYAAATRRAQDLSGDLTTTVLESVTGIRVIKGFRRGDDRIARFREQVARAREAESDKARLLGGIAVPVAVLPGLAMTGALVAGAVQVARGELSTGTLLAFMGTVAALRPAIEQSGGLLAVCHDGAAAADRYFEVLDQGGGTGSAAPTRQAPASHPAPPMAAPARRGPAELVLTDVGFRHPGAPAGRSWALRNVSLRVAPGETLAVVGPTGSGKTTLASLIAGLYAPTTGRITLDGADSCAVPRADWTSTVSVAFDEPVLFSGTLADNVLMGAEAAPGDVEQALRAACADTFVSRLADGLRTRVGENGLSLSGGQRQRIALARVLVRRPRLAVLDDPLSALDLRTEARVHDAVRRVLASTTAVVVAHRPSTVLLADRVAVLDEGRVVAVGTHEELFAASPAYRALMTSGLREGSDGRA
ncbi:ABC transporter ATP-binding protein [Streptomyces sp. ST1015]|nr:ABC transporter ATP-binding protein [Streptomyces sp. ST1015]